MKISGTIEQWLAGAGVQISDTAAGEALDDENIHYPFLVYSDIKNYDGPDDKNLFVRHSLYIYYYTERKTDETIEQWLNSQNIKFSCDKTFLDDDDCFECEYVINEDIITKIQGEK